MNTTIDSRLVAIYNEYLENDKEYEFINMLYALLDTVNQETRKSVLHTRAAWKRKTLAPVRKINKEKIEKFFNDMSPEELIEFQNTPWEEIPEDIREIIPKLVKNPEACNFVRIYGLVNEKERQKEICASRIVRYMESHGLITSDENGTHPHYKKFSEICNEIGEKFDLQWTKTHKAQRVRITERDLKNYVECRVTPKGDKLALLSAATGLPVWYLTGYEDNNPNIVASNPLEIAPFTKNRFRKSRVAKSA